MDQNLKQQVIERINGTTNVLVTVSANPSMDQLAACIGLTLVLNKLGKHATAVFSGKIPSTIEFLKPEDTLEKNTDSLRDFIISLDKSKADKLRYKVEDEVVRIFITPYKTSLSEKDLEFSEGDFNVDVVMALGVQKREDLDKTIAAHGRILHDATVIGINNNQASNIGSINWQDPTSSSLCEMVVDLSETLKPDSFDAQEATALLTGIVAETARFSNVKTTPRTMSLSAKLMAAGANQQLVAASLQTNLSPDDVAGGSLNSASESDKDDKGTLRIKHKDEPDTELAAEDASETAISPTSEPKPPEPLTPQMPPTPPMPPQPPVQPPAPQYPAPPQVPTGPQIGNVKSQTDSLTALEPTPTETPKLSSGSKMTVAPPVMGGTLTANSRPEDLEPTTDAMSLNNSVGGSPLLSHGTTTNPPQTPPAPIDNIAPNTIIANEPLSKVESDVASPHVGTEQENVANIDAARDAVAAAASSQPSINPEPLTSLGAQPLDMNVQGQPPVTPTTTTTPASPQPKNLIPPDQGLPPEQTGSSGPAAPPPPVPPPLMPPAN